MTFKTKLFFSRTLMWLWRFNSLKFARKFLGSATNQTFLECKLFGKRFQVDISRSDTQKLLYFEGERFIEERHLVSGLVKGKKGVVDIGANIGYYLLLFTKYAAPDAKSYCVEPSIENLPELERNIAINDLSDVQLSKVAVGEDEGKVGLRSGINSGVTDVGGSDYEVPVVPLDSIIKDPVDFIKIDVEGYEYQVLKGAKNTIAQNRPVVFLELHPKTLHRFGSSVRECLDFLAEYYDHMDFYLGDNSIGKETSFFGKVVDRVCPLYLGKDQTKKVELTVDDIGRIDTEHPWGTFWVVCH